MVLMLGYSGGWCIIGVIIHSPAGGSVSPVWSVEEDAIMMDFQLVFILVPICETQKPASIIGNGTSYMEGWLMGAPEVLWMMSGSYYGNKGYQPLTNHPPSPILMREQ